jgi:hypothetical protein
MAVAPMTVPLWRVTDTLGNVLTGATIWAYQAGTTAPLTTYQDPDGLTPHTHPIVTDAQGEATIYFTVGQAYKVNVLTPEGVQLPNWPLDELLVPAAPVSAGGLPEGVSVVKTTRILQAADGAATRRVIGGLVSGRIYLRAHATVTVTFGTAQGLQSLAVGPSSVMDFWGRGIGLVVDATNTNVAGHDRSVQPFSTTITEDLVVTAEGGLFDATGEITIVLYEMRFQT